MRGTWRGRLTSLASATRYMSWLVLALVNGVCLRDRSSLTSVVLRLWRASSSSRSELREISLTHKPACALNGRHVEAGTALLLCSALSIRITVVGVLSFSYCRPGRNFRDTPLLWRRGPGARPACVGLCGPLHRLAKEPRLTFTSQCLKTAPEPGSARRSHCSGSEANEVGISAELGNKGVRWFFSRGHLRQWLWSIGYLGRSFQVKRRHGVCGG